MGLVAVLWVLLLFEAGGFFGLFGLYGSYAVDVHINSEDVEKLLQLEWRLLDHATGLVIYRKVASSRPVYYSILNSFGQRSQYISIKFPLHN